MGGVRKVITTNIGTAYTITMDIDMGTAEGLYIMPRTTNGGNINLAQVYVTTSGTHTVTFTASTSTTQLLVEKAGTVTQTFYIDNVKVEQSTPTLNSYPIADVVSAQHYYPFGSTMQTWEADRKEYAFGFNGMEKDNEVQGDGNSYDYGARIYDSRLGRWLSVDPSEAKYPGINTYNFSLNNPIVFNDPDRKGGRITIQKDPNGNGGKMIMETTVHLYGQSDEILKNTANSMNEIFGKIKTTTTVKDVNGKCWEVTIQVTYKAAPAIKEEMVAAISGEGPTNSKDANQLPADVKSNIGFQNGDNILFIQNSSQGGVYGHTTQGANSGVSTSNPAAIAEETFHMFGFDEHYAKGLGAESPDQSMIGSVMATGGININPTYIHSMFFYEAASYWGILEGKAFNKTSQPFNKKQLEDTGQGIYILDESHPYNKEKTNAAQSIDIDPCCD